MDVRIRELTKKDYRDLRKIFTESLNLHERIDPVFTSIKDADQIWIKYIDTICQKDGFKIYIAKIDEKVVGYCVGQIITKPPVFKVTKTGQVNNIAVKDGYKHQGIGRLLFDKMKEWILTQNIASIELSAATNNPEALGFWKKMGAREFIKKMNINCEGE